MRQRDVPSIRDGVGATLRLAVPLMAAQIAVVGLGLVDTVTFGQLGMAALAGGGLATAVFSLIHIICVGVLAAVGNQIAYAYGANDTSGIRRAVQAGMIVAAGLGTFAGILTASSAPLLLRLGQSPAAVDRAWHFLVFAALGIAPSLVFTGLRGLTVGLGQPGPITVITIVAVVFKAALNGVILATAADLPDHEKTEFGLAWCGIAGTATYLFMAVALGWWCRRHFAFYLALPRFNAALLGCIGETLRLGIPIGVTYGVEAGLFTGVALIVGRFGDVALAAHHVANQCVYLTFMLAVGLSHAASVQAGHAAGAGDLREARRVSRQAIVIGLVIMTMTAITFVVFGRALADALVGSAVDRRGSIVDLAASLLFVAACFQWADGTQNIAMGALRGLKRARSTMVVATIGYWLIGLPAAWIFSTSLGLNADGAWWGLGVGLLATAAMLVLRLEVVTSPHGRDASRIVAA